MKIKLIIIICVYAIAIVSSYFIAGNRIDKNASKMYSKIYDHIMDVFKENDPNHRSEICGIDYSPNNDVNYNKVSIPQKPIMKTNSSSTDSIIFEQNLEHWKSYYSDIWELLIKTI